MLHFALTGQAAYPRETDEARLWAHLHAAPPEPSQLVPGVSAAFDEVVRRALEKRPEARPASAGELGAAALAAAGRPAAARAKRTAAPRRRRRSATAVTWPDGPRRGRRRPVLRAAAATAVLAGAVAAFLLTHEPRNAARATGAPPATTTIAAAPAKPPGGKEHVIPAPRVVRAIHVGPRPVNVEVAAGSAWIASTGSPTLDRVPLGGHLRRRGPRLGFGITDITNRRGELWVTVAASRQVVRVRASTGSPIGTPIAMIGQPRAIDAGEGAVWVAEQSPWGADTLVEIDPHTAMVVGRLPVPEGIDDVRAANGAVWVLGRHKPVLIKVSAASRQRVVTLPVGRHAERLDVAAGFVWVTDYGDDEVTRVDPKGPKIVKTDVPGRPYGRGHASSRFFGPFGCGARVTSSSPVGSFRRSRPRRRAARRGGPRAASPHAGGVTLDQDGLVAAEDPHCAVRRADVVDALRHREAAHDHGGVRVDLDEGVGSPRRLLGHPHRALARVDGTRLADHREGGPIGLPVDARKRTTGGRRPPDPRLTLARGDVLNRGAAGRRR